MILRFYVNLHTKQSTWEKPTAPAPRPDEGAPPGAPPPSYSSGPNGPQVSDTKRALESNNPYNISGHSTHETDEQYAARLQAEENSRGASDSYYGSGYGGGPNPQGLQGSYPGAPSSTSPLPPRPESSGKSKSFLGKLLGKSGGGYPQQPAGYNQGYPPQGYPQQAYGGYPQQGYGGYPQQGYGSPYGGGYGQPQKRKGGLGAGGAAALGLGGGLLGGALLADAINDGQEDAYQEGYDDGADGGGFDGGE